MWKSFRCSRCFVNNPKAGHKRVTANSLFFSYFFWGGVKVKEGHEVYITNVI